MCPTQLNRLEKQRKKKTDQIGFTISDRQTEEKKKIALMCHFCVHFMILDRMPMYVCAGVRVRV